MTQTATHIYITLALLFFSFTLLPLFLAGRLAQTLPIWHNAAIGKRQVESSHLPKKKRIEKL
jgi:hypothetical protein